MTKDELDDNMTKDEFKKWFGERAKTLSAIYENSNSRGDFLVADGFIQGEANMNLAWEASRKQLVEYMSDRIKNGKAKISIRELLLALGDFKDVPIKEE